MATADLVLTDNTIRVLDHGFVRLDDAMASDLSVVNAARVSFARRREEVDEADAGLIRFLMRDRHGTPFEHNAFRFHVRCPIFVAREWFRHRVGCLTGDAVVTFVDTNGHANPKLRKTMDELWSMWNVGERDGHALEAAERREIDRLIRAGRSERAVARELGIGRRAVRSHRAGATGFRDARWRLRRMRLRVLDEATGEFEVGHMRSVIDKGVQPVYRVTLADGKELTLTENHRVLTSNGWQRMGEAVGLTGDGANATMSRRCALMINGAVAHRDHRKIHRTSVSELDFAKRHGGQIGFARDVEVSSRRGFKLTAHAVEVASISYVGLRQTYDLEVEGPWHNFVANGIVVHNSFNEFSMRYAKATDDFYIPELEDVRSQVGKPGAYTFETVDPELAAQTREDMRAIYEAAFATYERLVEQGVAREVARAVLPVGAYTEFYWTINARSLMNFVSLRAAETAQREIRRYAEAVELFLEQRMPITHAAFVANNRVAP
jgi:thymidylate synthase ThyX